MLLIGKCCLSLELSLSVLLECSDFCLLGSLIPAQQRRDEVGHRIGGIDAAIGVLNGDAQSAGENVFEVQCALMGDGVAHLGPQVVLRIRQRFEQLRVFLCRSQDFAQQGTVAAEQVLDDVLVHSVALSQGRYLVSQRMVALGTQDWGAFGDGLWDVEGQLLDGQVNGVLPMTR